MSKNKEHNETTVETTVAEVQKILAGQNVVDTVEILATVMISLGCSLNNISGEITPPVIRQLNKRYYTPGQANIADALILQGYTMMTWGMSPDINNKLKGDEGDDQFGK